MKAFDTDVLTEVLLGDPTYVARAAMIPPHEQAVPVVVIEELLRGRLHVIRQTEAGQAKVDLARAYALFEQTLRDVRQVTVLSYIPQAEGLYQQWRQQRLRLPTHDLRIAAICIAHTATLISRNRRDFTQVPRAACRILGLSPRSFSARVDSSSSSIPRVAASAYLASTCVGKCKHYCAAVWARVRYSGQFSLRRITCDPYAGRDRSRASILPELS